MKNTHKITLGIIGIVIIALIGVWGFLPAGNQGNENKAPIANSNKNINTNKDSAIQTSLQIDRQDGSTVKVFSVKMEKDSTALAQLQKTAAGNDIVIDVKTSDFGSYVDMLDGLKGGTDSKYWMYSVNGKTAEVSADQYKLAEGDVVEWKFTK